MTSNTDVFNIAYLVRTLDYGIGTWQPMLLNTYLTWGDYRVAHAVLEWHDSDASFLPAVLTENVPNKLVPFDISANCLCSENVYTLANT